MSGRPAHVVELRLGDAAYAWSRVTGRHLRLGGTPTAARLDALGLGPVAPDPLGLVAVRHLQPLLVDGATLWAPDPTTHPAGGPPWRGLPLAPDEVRAWRACNGARTLRHVAELAGLADPVGFAARLCAPEVQALQLRPTPASRAETALERLLLPPRAPHADQARGLAAFHTSLDDAATRFDDAETTVAHAFAVAHPALGEPYGARLRRRLAARGAAVESVVEVGCGTGELAAAWAMLGPVDHLRIDLSPALLAAQAAAAPASRGLLGDAMALPLPDASVPLLVSNEVLADLPAELVDGRVVNVGALRFVDEVARVLRPGGRAWLSEFGGPDEAPTRTEQLDHGEVSIRFDDLVARARAHGLRAELEPLPDALGFDLDARWLWRPHVAGLRARLAYDGLRLAARAWSPDTLRLPFPVEGLRWVSLRDEGPGPLPARFWVLHLEKPGN